MWRNVTSKSLLLAGGVFLAPCHAQQPSSVPNEFHVDGYCHISEIVNGPKGPVQHIYKDRGICAVDPAHVSSRTETDMNVAQRKRIHVTIREHTFTLHNPTTEAATFVLDQAVPKGWQIDSDPQPNKVVGTVATYLVTVGPRQTVSLHVGERNPPEQ